MFPRADIVGTRPVASPEATRPTILTGDASQELYQRLERIAVGTFFRGEVLSHLQDGSFVVKVADSAVRMNLPAGTQVGEALDLTLAEKQPRLTFLLGRPPVQEATSLSNAGRLIDRILHAAQDDGAPQVIVGKTPLVSSPNVKPEQLASAMKSALVFSGVFYESHVGQWASGQRPLQTLMYEPQAKNSDPRLLSAALRAAIANANARSAASEAALPSAEKPAIPLPASETPPATSKPVPGTDMPDTQQLARLIENLQGKPELARALLNILRASPSGTENPTQPAGTQAPSPANNAPALPTAPVIAADAGTPAENTLASSALLVAAQSDPGAPTRPETMSSDSVRMINLQLNTLEQHRVVWQGELWPGQQIEWEVGEEPSHGKEATPDDRVWQSVVRFDMPTLGPVSATIRLAGGHVQIQVRTADENTAAILRKHGGALSAALDAAGAPLDHLAIKSDDRP